MMTNSKLALLISIVLFLNGIFQIYANLNMLWIQNINYFALNLLCAFGLVFQKSWSKHYIYVLSALSIGGWIDSVIRLYRTGWPIETVQGTIASLIPGLFLISGWIFLIIYTSIFFSKIKNTEKT